MAIDFPAPSDVRTRGGCGCGNQYRGSIVSSAWSFPQEDLRCSRGSEYSLPTRAFAGKVESGGVPKEARIGFKIPTGARGPVMNGEAIL
jgi:hypothetical protein